MHSSCKSISWRKIYRNCKILGKSSRVIILIIIILISCEIGELTGNTDVVVVVDDDDDDDRDETQVDLSQMEENLMVKLWIS